MGFTVAPSGARYTSVDWSSSDKSTATVDDGIVTVLKPGKFVISAVIDGSVKVKWDFDIEPEGDISSDGSIEYDPDDGYQFNNTSISGLKENRDYIIEKETVSDNVIKIKAKGIGFYTGEVTAYFTKNGDEFDNKGNDWSYDDSTLMVDGTTKSEELSNVVLVEAVNNNSSKNVKSIEIGLSIKKITNSTFDNIDGIKEVVFDGDAPSISDNAFEGMTVTITYSQRAKGWDSIVSSNKQFGGNVTYKMIPCEHVWDAGVETTPATFTATGIKTFTCKECGTTKTGTIPVKVCSHRWDSGVVTVVATETTIGNRRYTCLDCGVTRDEVIPMLTPSPKAEDQTTIVPSPNPQPWVVPTPSVTPTTADTPQSPADETVNTFTTKQGTFKITGAKTVTFTKPASKVASVVIPATVSYKGYSYKIKAIGDGAFKNNKKLRIITIGKNVDTIGKDAFNGCKNLKTIIINSSKIKSVGKTAFKNTSNKPTVKCPKKKIKLYKKLLQTAKLSKKAKVKKL